MSELTGAEIDFQAIAESLRIENERLRLYILKLKYDRRLIPEFDLERIPAWLKKHYVEIAAVCILLITLTGLLSLAKGFFHAR